VSEVQKGMTTLEFFEWMEFLRWETEEHRDKSEHYMASLTAEVRRSWVSKPNTVKASDFLVTFRTRDPEKNNPPPALAQKTDDVIAAMSDEEYDRFVAQQAQTSKGAWLAWVDMGQKPTPTKI
jgi:hypothetical protein